MENDQCPAPWFRVSSTRDLSRLFKYINQIISTKKALSQVEFSRPIATIGSTFETAKPKADQTETLIFNSST